MGKNNYILNTILTICLGLVLATLIQSCTTISDQEFEVNGVKFKMIAVEGGSFMMGATPGQGTDARENEKPAHKVTVDDFLIGETEVTQELWFAVMGGNPSHFKWLDGDHPVENVSWNDVQEFIKKLNEITGHKFRLPYEIEWEYAARGGKKSTDKKYAGSDDIDEVAWYKDNAEGHIHAVANKKSNELGIYDMSGNVWEWCEGLTGNYEKIEVNMRGGAYVNTKNILRVSQRFEYLATDNQPMVGFRLLLTR